MRVGFAKIGQRLQLDPGGFAGSYSPARLLQRLARRNPEVAWFIFGRSRGWNPVNYPANVQNVWSEALSGRQGYHNTYVDGVRRLEMVNPDVVAFEDEVVIPLVEGLDGAVIFLGTNTSGSIPIPKDGKTWADGELMKPHEAMLNTGRYIIEGLNRLGDRTDGEAPVVFLVEDPRNALKSRDLKWPTGTGARDRCNIEKAV